VPAVGHRLRLPDRLRLQQLRQPDDVWTDAAVADIRGHGQSHPACGRAAALSAPRIEGDGMNPDVRLGAAPPTRWLDGLLLVAGILLLWQGASWGLGTEVLPGPIRTLTQLQREIAEPDFPQHLIETSKAFFTALLIAVLAGTCLGLVLGVRRLAGDVMEPILIALYSIPKISLYPIILLMLGLGLSA